MGAFPKKNCTSSPFAVPNSAPNPDNYKVIKYRVFRNKRSVMVLQVHYPDAKNYEGMKTLVYVGYTKLEQLLAAADNKLDPHFSSTSISPCARFEPSIVGWSRACKFAEMISNE